MPHHSLGTHHLHVRKRIHQKHEHYPHPNKLKRVLDKAVYAIGAFGLIMTIPQITIIWVEKNAAGVSAGAWFAYTIVAMFWLLYGIVHKEKPLIMFYSLAILLNAIVLVGTLVYG